MATSLIFQITDAGVRAATSANAGGPKINLTSFQVGSAYGYVPSHTDTALHGTALYEGLLTNYQEVDVDTVAYTLAMDQTVGTFNFGEIGIFTDTGVLFALATLQQLQEKVQATSTNPGNFVSFQSKLVLSNLAPAITFTQVTSTSAQLLEIPAPDGLSHPSVPANPNVYSIQGGDDQGNPIVAVRETTAGLWSFSTHPIAVFSGAIDSASSVTSAGCSTVVASAFSFATNRYILQFTSGVNKGVARYVSAIANGSMSFAALATAPSTGDTFEIYESTAFRTSLTTYATDSGVANSYVLSSLPAVAAANGMVLSFIAKQSNTGPSTATVGNVQYPLVGMGGALQGGEIVSGFRQHIVFDNGTCYLLSSESGAMSVGAASGTRQAVQLGQLQNASLNVYFNGVTGTTLTTSGAAAINGLLTSTAGLSLQNGTGVAVLQPDANTNNLRVRVGALGSYKYAVLDASANLTLGGALTATGNVLGANATATTHAVMLGQLQNASLAVSLQSATVAGTLSASLLQVSTNAVINGTVTAANATQDSQAAMLGQVKARIQALLPIGHLLATASPNTPPNYLPCDGAAYSRTVYAQLFAQIGTIWGAGDGSTTFNVPDFRRRVMMGSGGVQGSAQAPGTTVGSYGGEETHVLTTAEMPQHAHPITDTGHAHPTNDPTHAHAFPGDDQLVFASGYFGWTDRELGNFPYDAKSNYGGNAHIYLTTNSSTGVTVASASTGINGTNNTGGNGAHNNVQPAATVSIFIKYQ